jgi:zinc/manganese transport system substrate-binding protein/manganese/iron transport system substrate-binding protein
MTIMTFGCGTATESRRPGSADAVLDIVTTTTVFADIVANVGGERVSATSIIPAGVGPEDYEPKPDDAKLLAEADLIVSNGVGLDDFLDTLFASGSGEAAARLVLGDGIPTIEEEDRPNPHFWLDPTLVERYYLPAIVETLSGLDPPGIASYEENAAAYAASLDDLDRELQAEVDQLPPPNRKLVTFHDAFPYFARHFGFELVGVVVDSVGQEPSAAELAALVEKVRAAHVNAVFSEAQFNPRLTDTLAQEAGITNVVTTLYNDALGPPPADSYIGLMRWNVAQIVAALR